MIFDNAVFIKPDVEFNREFSFENYAPVLRKKFHLKETKNAKLYVCGLGFGYYFLNGKKVSEDLFTAPFGNYMKSLWYNEYDVSHLLLKGENVITIFLGNGFLNETIGSKTWSLEKAMWRDVPKVILRLEVDGKTALVSDDSFKCLENSAVFFNQIRRGEYFNANLYDESITALSYDDSAWNRARKDYTQPTGVFRKNECPPIRECEVLSPISVRKTGKNKYLFDMGRNISGYIRLTVSGIKDDLLTIRYSEEVNENFELDHRDMDVYPSYYVKEGFQTDKFICSGKKITWSPKFTYHGFRYIEIDGITDIQNTDVLAVFVHQKLKRRTEFNCSDSFLNKLFEAGVNSTYSNMFYCLTDCPTREKMAWTNDVAASVEQIMINFEAEAFFEKCQQDVFDSMLSDGSMPGIIPSPGWWYKWEIGPIGDAILFEIPYRMYLYTGDKTLLKKSLPYFEKHFRYIDSKKDEKGFTYHGLGDWSPPEPAFNEGVDEKEVPLINACFEHYFYKIASLIDDKKYAHKAEETKRFVIDNFIDASGRCTVNKQCSVSMLIYYDLFDDINPLKNQLLELVQNNNFHLYCGMVGIRRLFHALTKCGLPEVAYKVLTLEGHPGYKHWFDMGATTLFERWEPEQIYSSHNHHMFSDFMSWMIKNIVGISTSYEEELSYNINPIFFKELDFANCTYDSLKGRISVSWKRQNDEIHLTIEKDDNVLLFHNGVRLDKNKTEFRYKCE